MHGIDVEVVKRSDVTPGFVPVAKQWVVEQTNGTLMLHRRLVREYESRPASSVSRTLQARDRPSGGSGSDARITPATGSGDPNSTGHNQDSCHCGASTFTAIVWPGPRQRRVTAKAAYMGARTFPPVPKVAR